jgi:AcrR family transcriptional regulator
LVTSARATDPPSPPRSRYRRGEGALLREDILNAASELFVQEGGEEGVTIRAVAAAVGVSPPSVYLHFADKDELIFAVCQSLFAQLTAALEAAVAGIDDPFDSCKARATAYVRFGLEHPEHYRVLFMHPPQHHPEGFGPEEIKASAAFESLVAEMEAMMATGLLREGLDPYMLAIEAWTSVHGITSLVISHPDFPWPGVDAFLDHHFTTVLQGLLRRD